MNLILNLLLSPTRHIFDTVERDRSPDVSSCSSHTPMQRAPLSVASASGLFHERPFQATTRARRSAASRSVRRAATTAGPDLPATAATARPRRYLQRQRHVARGRPPAQRPRGARATRERSWWRRAAPRPERSPTPLRPISWRQQTTSTRWPPSSQDKAAPDARGVGRLQKSPAGLLPGPSRT